MPIRLAAQQFGKGQALTTGFLQVKHAQDPLATGHV
jgi:hypothetical protein